jgi:hypothetical protein
MESDRAVNVALDYLPAGLTGVVQADGPARVRIHARQAPARATLNGKIVTTTYDAATRMISLAVPAGSNAIAVSWTNVR